MRKFMAAVFLIACLVGLGAPALAETPAPPPVSAEVGALRDALAKCGITLPTVELPSVCDLKVGLVNLAASLKLTLEALLVNVGKLAVSLRVGLEALLAVILKLPSWLQALLCL